MFFEFFLFLSNLNQKKIKNRNIKNQVIKKVLCVYIMHHKSRTIVVISRVRRR
jgi:hypothetical protein